MRILVADDSGVMRKLIVRSLQSIGFDNTVEANDGCEALDLFLSDSFDLVLTDWNMPNKTGLELVQAIRSSGSLVPVIMITTVEQKDAIATALESGVNDLLTKPFTTEDLLASIENLVAC